MRSQKQETFHHSVSSSSSSSGSKVGITSSVTVRFFWETLHRRHRARFNLLLLDHNEYLLEDLSAYCFPAPSDATISSASTAIKDALKIQGRLKLCSKSLVFEPTDVHYPVMKFPYKQMSSDVTLLSPKTSSASQQLSEELRGLFTFTSSAYFELKEGNKVGPYKMVEGSVSMHNNYQANSSSSSTFRLVFALVHADVDQFMVKIEQLRHIVTLSQRQGSLVAYQLLKPFIEAAQLWTQRFDVSNLVNFHETLQRSGSVAALKIRPLTTHPGSLMVTDTRVYFQPSQLNNVGDATVLHFELTKVRRIFRRRYLLRQVGLEFLLIDGASHLFVLDTTTIRNDFYTLLLSLQGLPSSVHTDVKTIESLTLKWQRRDISNFEYLMSLNDEADRSVNDLTQYPVS
jgi:factor associated with neutral sphingomyelinase activation